MGAVVTGVVGVGAEARLLGVRVSAGVGKGGLRYIRKLGGNKVLN